MLALLLATSLSFVFFLGVFFPGGLLLARKFLPQRSPLEDVALALVCASLVSVFTLASCRLLGLPLIFQQWLFRGLAFFALCSFIASGSWREYFRRDILSGLSFWALAFLAATFSAAYPTAKIGDVHPYTIQRLAGLATDNLIPYHVARIFTEDIPFFAYEIVPGWSFTDRGPAAGMMSAVMMFILGVKDNGLWLSAKPGVFFSFEAFLVWLNTFSLFVLWTLAMKYFNRRAALACTLLLSTSFFFWVNSFFTWPKLYAGAVFLLGLSWFLEKRVICGAVLALSLLVHESVVFSLLSLGAYALWFGILSRERKYSPNFLLRSAATFVLIYAPWSLFKLLAAPGPSRLLNYNLFCLEGAENQQLPFFSALTVYLKSQSVWEMVSVRLGNLVYPFNFFHAADSYLLHWASPVTLLFSVSHLVFYQLLYAVGIPSVLLVLMMLRRESVLWPFLAVGFGGQVFAGLLIACPLMTVNHTWAYPLFLLLTLAAGISGARKGVGTSVLFVAAIISNICFSFVCFYFVQPEPETLRASAGFVFLQGTTLALFYFLLLSQYLRASHE